MKGVLKEDHIAVNNYVLLIPPLGVTLIPTEISGLEEELEVAELPDRTKASGGNTKATEFTMKIAMHHVLEMASMEAWFAMAQDPVMPAYKYAGVLIHKSISGGITRTYELSGMFPTKRTLPDLEMANEGEMAVAEWTISVDQLTPLL